MRELDLNTFKSLLVSLDREEIWDNRWEIAEYRPIEKPFLQ